VVVCVFVRQSNLAFNRTRFVVVAHFPSVRSPVNSALGNSHNRQSVAPATLNANMRVIVLCNYVPFAVVATLHDPHRFS
jgi:hypothetical protein